MFWRLTMYVQFAPKMEEICVVQVLSFCTWKHCKFGHFWYRSHIRQERAVSTRRPVKVEFWKICKRITFWGRPKESIYASTFLSLIVQHLFGRNFYAIWEFYRDREAFCLGRIACFNLLNISRLFRQLCQHQAQAANHQPTKCGTADFHNRQNGTSQESNTFPIRFLQLASSTMFSIDNYMYEKNQVIKRKRKKKFFSSALF